MSAITQLASDHEAVLAALPAGEVSHAARRATLEMLAEQGLPGPREENWRYANLRPLEQLRFTPRLTPDAAALAQATELLPAPLAGFDRYVVVDGLFAAPLSAPTGTAGDVEVALQAGIDAGYGSAGGDARFGALASAFAPQAIRVAAGAGAARDIEVVFVATAAGSEAASYPALLVKLAAQAHLRLVERHIGACDAATFANAALAIEVGAAGQLRHVRVQQAGAQATHFETLRAEVADSAEYLLDTVALGAQSARSTTHARLAGRGARIAYSRSVAVDATRVNDAVVVIEHAAPATITAQDYRGIAAGRARVAFNGHVIMRANAAGSASSQSLRSLLAGPGTEADVRPQLEIYTDDVKASHGATAGKIDEQMLFYLLSRGIERRTAQSLLKWAFLTELIARIPIPDLRAQVERAFAQRFTGEDAAVTRELV
ncbi:MAG TPA: SufD family Fe-S cluster assembly protein [Steroidobacteraceae bacterium]|nr:SufD family Fe-S cluster assembly protein [Steroidobacteraceae bacterium]HNS28617.1 SufD family Fe-S cluster assembly protein [Steroidobacteraceae bacterium]